MYYRHHIIKVRLHLHTLSGDCTGIAILCHDSNLCRLPIYLWVPSYSRACLRLRHFRGCLTARIINSLALLHILAFASIVSSVEVNWTQCDSAIACRSHELATRFTILVTWGYTNLRCQTGQRYFHHPFWSDKLHYFGPCISQLWRDKVVRRNNCLLPGQTGERHCALNQYII